MVHPVGLLLFLPLHRVHLGLVLVHLTREEATPRGVKLFLAQFALLTPLLSVGTAYMVLELSTSEGLVATTYMLS